MAYLAELGALAGILGLGAAAGTAIAAVAPTHRQCTIEVTNKCSNYTLCNPSEYIVSGRCSIPLSQTIQFSESASALFIKTPNTACGSVGVFTYDLVRNDTKRSHGKMAVMFSVPYDFNMHSNWYAVGIFYTTKSCDYDLYHQMYEGRERSFSRATAKGPSLQYNCKHVTIRANMSDTYQPVMKVEVAEE
ncbi:uncharacterized protein LOC142992313 [Genypterus blacodes]|uniref:uncharacterized protein LOC142992313 n=1 Tax=Genypterus blacodes TaxID=154954 RepID=UPI003F7624F9